MYNSVSAWCVQSSVEGGWLSEAGERGLWVPWYECWEANMVPSEEQQVFLITEPYLQLI